jgi:hypothetical protein
MLTDAKLVSVVMCPTILMGQKEFGRTAAAAMCVSVRLCHNGICAAVELGSEESGSIFWSPLFEALKRIYDLAIKSKTRLCSKLSAFKSL